MVGTTRRRLVALFAYAGAMAFVESAVVVYLRLLYFPSGAGYSSALPFSPLVYRTEVIREVATIVMLLAVAWLAFGRGRQKLLAFVWIFAVWDVFYYVFLKMLIGWPPSLGTLDVLFLIPAPWIAPVWVPLAVWSAVFAVSSVLLLRDAA